MAFLLPILAGIANVMEIVTFIQFIEEEAIQTCSMATWCLYEPRVYETRLCRGQYAIPIHHQRVWA